MMCVEASDVGLVEALRGILPHPFAFTAMETDKVLTGYERDRERERENMSRVELS